MKYRLLIILTVLTISSFGQEIERIIFTSQQADEPPTKQGRPKFRIEFTRQASGDFVGSYFYQGKRRNKLKNKATIDKGQVEKIIEWKKLGKSIFSQSDLGFDITTLKSGTNSYGLNFDVPTDLVVSVDSFQFCQTYRMTENILIGGETRAVTLIYKTGQKQEFIFDSDDIGTGNFNLRDYILCYTLLAEKIPNKVPSYGFFSKSKLTDIMLWYQKTVECEGYYYKEFTDKNPNMTSKDKRMKTGWDFVEYMRQRNKK
jgi:hypothetical protein